MKFEDLPEQWQETFSNTNPDGRKCQKCGGVIRLSEATFTKNSGGRVVMDRFCRDCMKAYWKALADRKGGRSSFRKNATVNRSGASSLGSEQGRKPLPVLELGKKYRIGGEYTGRVVAMQGSHFVVETRTGTRCFTRAQLVGVEIKEA